MTQNAAATTTTTTAARPAAGRIRPGAARLARGFGYLAVTFPVSLVAFFVSVAGFSLGVSTLVVWIGVPILSATLLACRGLAHAERRAIVWATGRELPAYYYRSPDGSRMRRMAAVLLDPQPWRDVLHAVLAFPIRVSAFLTALGWAIGGLGGLTYGLWEWALPHDPDNTGLFELITGTESRLADIVLNTAAGVLTLAVLPLLVRGLVACCELLARGLLTNQSAALRARNSRLESSRRAAVQAEAQTLRRLERDIHDGPQQRLVRLNMDLEAVARRLDDDPQAARPLVDGALVQSKEALDELRALSRGIAPPILADRGLGPALAAAAARCPVQVSLDVALPDGRRLAAAVENTAYFVVTEALTNVAKHSRASWCAVTVSADAQRVLVQVSDDGVGGAHAGKGHGLAGLGDRLEAVDGRLDLVSPVGGPTVLTADIPLVGVGEDGREGRG